MVSSSFRWCNYGQVFLSLIFLMILQIFFFEVFEEIEEHKFCQDCRLLVLYIKRDLALSLWCSQIFSVVGLLKALLRAALRSMLAFLHSSLNQGVLGSCGLQVEVGMDCFAQFIIMSVRVSTGSSLFRKFSSFNTSCMHFEKVPSLPFLNWNVQARKLDQLKFMKE